MIKNKKLGRPALPAAARLEKYTLYLNAEQRQELARLSQDTGLSGPAVLRRALALLAAARELLA